MARVINCGFELNSLTVGHEISSTSTGLDSPTISSSIFRSGSYALRISSKRSGNGMNANLDQTSGTTSFFVKVHFYITTLPSAANRIIHVCNQGVNTMRIAVALNSDGTLTLLDEDGTIGTGSTVLSTGIWYALSVGGDLTAAAGSHIVTLKVNGTNEVTASNRNISTALGRVIIGGNLAAEAQTQGDWYFDDVIANNAAGSVDNSWPNYASKLVYLRPNAAGDNSAWTPSAGNNWDCVEEIPPSDTDYVSSNTLNQLDMYNLGASATGTGTVNSVHLYVRGRDNASAASRTKTRIEATSGGTVEASAALNLNSTFQTYNNQAIPSLSLVDLPGASTTAWTATDLDAAQIGLELSTAGTANTDVSVMWLVVDYLQAYSLSVDPGSYSETGTAATLKAGRKLSVDAGSYTWTGTDATLTYVPVSGGYTLTVDPGAYTFSGTAANLYYGRKLSVDSGTYTVSGTDVAFLRGYSLSASSGIYTIAGTAANLLWAHILTATDGTYLITGSDATLARLFTLAADPGAYTITGTAADLLKALLLSLGEGAYTITGTNAVLVKNIPLSADAGSFVITGTDATFPRTYLVTAVPGQYVITGSAADLVPWLFPLPDPGEWMAIAPYVVTRFNSYSDSTRGTATDQPSFCYSTRVTDVAMYNRAVSANSYNDSTRGVSNRNQITTGFSV